MHSLKQHRQQALALLNEYLTGDEPTLMDYKIDEYLRLKLNLPDRPEGDEPYVGWMVGEKEEVKGKMRTSQTGIDLIKKYEGLRTNAYMCPASVLTIGYGHTKNVAPGMKITPEKAEDLLKEDLVRFEDAVNKYVTKPLTQNQFDALVSFAFNVGVNAFANSTMLRLLCLGHYFQAASQFSRWVHGGGQKLPGLVRRREEERKLFLTE